MSHQVRGFAIVWMTLVTVALAWTDPAQAVEPTASSAEVTKAAAVAPADEPKTKSGIALGSCHFQKTPPYEPRLRLECENGEVVVAVFDDGIRCCALELR